MNIIIYLMLLHFNSDFTIPRHCLSQTVVMRVSGKASRVIGWWQSYRKLIQQMQTVVLAKQNLLNHSIKITNRDKRNKLLFRHMKLTFGKLFRPRRIWPWRPVKVEHGAHQLFPRFTSSQYSAMRASWARISSIGEYLLKVLTILVRFRQRVSWILIDWQFS